jgi:multidrug efflux pump subunit AcrA (membrane-fusion protein)
LIAQGKLDTANINLGYTDIVSPIAGKIGRTNITKGNVVSPQGGTLTTIISQDPMYVLLPVSRPTSRARGIQVRQRQRYYRHRGLSADELVVVQGLESLRPGMGIWATPVPAALNRS